MGSKTNPTASSSPSPTGNILVKPQGSTLRRLNYDVLEYVYEYLRPGRDLRPFSMTCKWYRASCKPILFRRAITRADLLTEQHFLPQQLWNYVHTLTFEGEWVYPNPPYSRYRPIYLDQVLPRIPRLTRIRVWNNSSSGLPRRALHEILTLPRLRAFEAEDTLHHYAMATDESLINSSTFHSAPLTCYRHVFHDYRSAPRIFSSDLDTIACIASQEHVQQALQVLVLPSEAAPLSILGDANWPELKVLSLRGEDTSDQPLLCAFGRMPALEELRLEMSRPIDAEPTLVFCPADWSGPFPWPRLKRLIVSYPDPDDPLWSQISRAGDLQHLELRCWPRHYLHHSLDNRVHMAHLGWHSPILLASELLYLLSRCRSSNLLRLDIEYSEDEDDLELLRHIPIFFPNLESLTIHRYRRSNTANVPIHAIGEALAPLSRLQVIYLHLDLNGAPHPWARCGPRGDLEMARHYQALEDASHFLARSLGLSVRAICLLFRDMRHNIWKPFRIVRTIAGVHTSSDAAFAKTLNLREEDDLGPPLACREWESITVVMANS
ncbi:hypothetical protein FKP32DRAFT_1604722 [Trametes sanguinea]|nr:hypothetical protein FKP32DRAFT_1604722 [Trametes sanguinea]